jgi:hypothetical protein
MIVLVSQGRSIGIVSTWRAALAFMRTARRVLPLERHTVRAATVRDLWRLPRLELASG